MFKNREDAGKQLGKALEKYQSERPLILGIPRGGVEVGYHVALTLDCDFDVIVVRKLGHPQQPEAAFGALAEDGSLYLNPWSNKYLTKKSIEKVMRREQKEIGRRIEAYRQGQALPELTDRLVVLVDDGIATGSTISAAINMCGKKHPKKVVVAAPVAGIRQVRKIAPKVDEIVILSKREEFYAVSQAYINFSNLADNEVIYFMEQWRKKAAPKVRFDQ
ncbi:MAG: phosphoribosyltransferase [Bacteroidota bacterium]